MSTAKVRDAANTSWLDMATVASVKVRNQTNTGWITKNPNELGYRNQANTGWIYTGAAAYTPPNPYNLTLIRNDLDFIYTPTIPSPGDETYIVLNFTISFDDFFTTSGDHIPFAVNCQRPSPNQPSGCDVIRNGFNLFSEGRGFYIKAGTDQIYSEHWNGTSNPGVGLVYRELGTGFDPAINTQVQVEVKGGFRIGAYTNKIILEIRDMSGTMLFSGQADLGWDTEASYSGAIGGIAGGYVGPTPAGGCVEKTDSGIAPNASATISDIVLSVF